MPQIEGFRTNFIQWFSKWLPAALLLIAALTVTVFLLWHKSPVDELRIVSTGPVNLELTRERLALYRQQAEDIKELVTKLLLLAGLFTGVQSLFALFSAQGFQEQAREAVDKLQSLNKKQRRFLEKNYPLFGSVEKMFQDMLNALASVTQAVVMKMEAVKLSGEDRQKIKFYEAGMAWFDLLDAAEYKEQVSDIFGRLGRFYILEYDQHGKKQESLDRARFYSTKAVVRTNRHFKALNNYAATWLAADKPTADESRTARRLLEESLRLHPNQQRALYVLAWIEDEENDFTSAVEHLRTAKALTAWEDTPDPTYLPSIRYNYACALVKRAAERDEGCDSDPVREAIRELKELLATTFRLRKLFEDDLKEDLKYLKEMCPEAVDAIRATWS